MEGKRPLDEILISEVVPADLDSIKTIHVRAFHGLDYNEWHRNTFPNTAEACQWWADRYTMSTADKDCHNLKAAHPDSPNEVLGVLCLRRMAADTRGVGTWSSLPRCKDHPAEPFDTMVQAMTEGREKYMFGRPHYLLEHFAIDLNYQRGGLGGRMLAAALVDAKRDGLDVFVESNEFASPFYIRHDFTEVGRDPVSGGMDEVFCVKYHSKQE